MKIDAMRTSGVIGSLAFCLKAMPGELTDFVYRVGDGEGLSSGNPALTLRNYILKNKVSHGLLVGHERACMQCAMHAALKQNLSCVKSSYAGMDFFCAKQPDLVAEIADLF
jgi:hypothetical protein